MFLKNWAMKLNYKRIGDFIQLIDERNAGLKVKTLLGLTISKNFIPSVANIIGTDMENYKIIRKNQFACSTMQVRRDGKMPVALLKDMDEAIISQAYPVFEITDAQKLLPEYLMMWFSRSEFDREACFYAIGGVRGSLEWDDFCDMQLPVPPVEKQQEIVAEYKTVTNRIEINNRLIQKLEETAQAIYKQWFVDFEFPDEEGKVKISNYMETNPQLTIKKNSISSYVEMNDLTTTSMSIKGVAKREFIGGSKFQNNDTLLARITPCLENGKTAFVDILEANEVAAGSTEFIVMRAKKSISPYWVYCLARDEKFRSYAISSMVGSSGRQRVHEKYLEDYMLPKISIEIMEKFHETSKSIFEMVTFKSKEISKLEKLKSLLLSRLATVGNVIVEKNGIEII
jgi:type I restriction enzyme S subunit